MSNEDVQEDDGFDSDEERASMEKKVTELTDELEARKDQIEQLNWQKENHDGKLKVVERQVKEWERIATIVQGLGKDEDDLIKILKEKDALELKNEELKIKIQDLQRQIDNFDNVRQDERKHAKDLEVQLRDSKITLKETEDIRKQGALFHQKISSLKSKVDKADSAVKAEKNKTTKANQEKAKAVFEATQAQKKITRQLETLKQQKKEMDKLKSTLDETTSERDTLRAQFKSTQEEYEDLTRLRDNLQDEFKSKQSKFDDNTMRFDSKLKEIELLKTEIGRKDEKLMQASGWKSLHEIVDELAPKEEEKKMLEAQKIQLRAEVTKEQNRTRESNKNSVHWQDEYNKKQSNLYDVLASHKQELQDLTKDWKEKISKANTCMELEKQRADELEGEVAKRTQETLTYQTELQAYKKNHKMLEIRIDDLEAESTQLQEERDAMRDIVDCTQTEMTTLLGALKNMEIALDRMKANDQAVEDAKFLKEKCGSLETQVKDYQKQLGEAMNRYMKGLKEQKDKAHEQLDGARNAQGDSAAIAAAMGMGQQDPNIQQNSSQRGSEPPTPREKTSEMKAKNTAIVSKLRAERDVLKGELDRCYKSLTNTRMQRDNMEMALMSRDTEIQGLRNKLQGVLRNVQQMGGMDNETTVLQGLVQDMGKYAKAEPKPKGRTKGGKMSVGQRLAQRGGRKPAPRQAGPSYGGAQQGPRKVYGGHKPKGRRRQVVPEE